MVEMFKTKYSVMHRLREQDEDPLIATVIVSYDEGYTWHYMCECHPDFAEQIATALQKTEEMSTTINSEDIVERLRAAGDALAEECWNNRLFGGSADQALKAWWEARRGQ